MPLFLDQLVFTSFLKVGFKLLASEKVPKELQQVFLERVVHTYWDSYNPPRFGYQAVYLHQVTLDHSLFGWLYNDGADDIGRNHVPYFVCYHLAHKLHAFQLENIFTCLYKGPVALIERQSLPGSLEALVAPDLWSYQPARTGVAIPSGVRDHSYIALKQGKLLDLFVPINETEMIAELNAQTCEHLKQALSNHIGSMANVIVRQVVDQAVLLRDPYQQALQVYQKLVAEVEDPLTVPGFQAEVKRLLNLTW